MARVLFFFMLLMFSQEVFAFNDSNWVYRDQFEEIDESLAIDIANFTCANLEKFPRLIVRKRFEEIADGHTISEEWLEKISSRANKLSRGKVILLTNYGWIGEDPGGSIVKFRLINSGHILDMNISHRRVTCEASFNESTDNERRALQLYE